MNLIGLSLAHFACFHILLDDGMSVIMTSGFWLAVMERFSGVAISRALQKKNRTRLEGFPVLLLSCKKFAKASTKGNSVSVSPWFNVLVKKPLLCVF